ncbi:MAG TPA: trigger factor [Hypericibacter adhaerens]|jgi:trigger factor|uniref:Trigger factor n=1 Tax=Hypericibacter adhaerens TaxID=2602016 RepID=A0A5J6N5Y1_9PROT|nr:trigger factor [Hypericibacter adhaerens]QEX22376.1 trigger factor [Hypericibacter adhaerens]HWA45984.1 trigger factor [Hypericibacter adhaerens]
MQVTETANEGLKREFKIVIPAKDFEKKIENELQEYGRQVRLPGFRPGKVPMPVLKQRFGTSVRGKVIQDTVQDASFQVLNERGLKAAGQPRIEITKGAEGEDVEYNLAIELMPEIKPMDFKAIELERLAAEVTDKDVTEALDRFAAGQKRSQPVASPRPAQKGDVVVIDFEGKIDDVPFQGGKAEGHYLELGSGSTIPGFEDQIIGHQPGDSFTIDVTFPEAYPSPEVAGKPAKFDITIKELREPQPVVVDDELAKSVGLESLDALKTQIKGRLERDAGSLSRGRLKRQLLDKLAAGHEFTLPPGLVDTEFDAIWQQIVADRQAGRLDPDDAGKSEDELKKEYREIAERRVKLGLLLSEVGRQHNIEVSNDEIGRAIMAEASRYAGNERKVIEYYQRTPEALAQIRAPLYEEKVVDYILDQAKVSERKVPLAEVTFDDQPAKS